MTQKHYVALAYYQFVSIDEPHDEVKKHKLFFERRDCAGRIYLSEEGINGQMSGSVDACEAYMAWLKQDSRFSTMRFQIHPVSEPIFPRLTIKYRSQLVALDLKVDLSQGGVPIAPDKWKEMLESGDYMVLDVRNHYESAIGHFEGAVLPPLNSFREFPQYAENLKNEVDASKTKVMMYCTGGIRCELYSAVLKNKGFAEVYQLEGGVINYGLKEGNKHWKGKLFVFDDRLAVSIDGKESAPIACCSHCRLGSDVYYNCANMDCNELFICCPSCHAIYRGCCSHACTNAPRVRPFDSEGGNKPFRRKHLISIGAQDPKCASESEESQR